MVSYAFEGMPHKKRPQYTPTPWGTVVDISPGKKRNPNQEASRASKPGNQTKASRAKRARSQAKQGDEQIADEGEQPQNTHRFIQAVQGMLGRQGNQSRKKYNISEEPANSSYDILCTWYDFGVIKTHTTHLEGQDYRE